MRHLWHRLAVLWELLADRVRPWSARARATEHYGRAKRVAVYVVSLMAATICSDVVDWLLHGR
ncbi:hypothetical protein GCM10010321_88900 [Streptomyces chartreusis]|nr:hypothetical protein GCM10010321_88900 [Streptomyces chartreusis]